MFKDYYACRDWLETFIPFTYSKKNLGLERIEYLLKHLGNPHKKFKSIHIAGTSGKGSTAYYTARLLSRQQSADGRKLKVGLHISPHLVDVRERMQIFGSRTMGGLMPMVRFLNLFSEIRQVVEGIQKTKSRLTPSYFEILVAASFKYFAEEKVDFAVVEVGLGGRLDATNVLQPLIALITNVGLDHTEILGKTIEKVGYEKAGIIKPATTVITGATGKALEVIRKVAKSKKARLITKDTLISEERPKLGRFNYIKLYIDILKNSNSFVPFDNFFLSLATLNMLGISITNAKILEAFKTPFAGRFEEIKPNVILDGAHNIEKIKALVNFLKNSKLETLNSKQMPKYKIQNTKSIILVVAFKKGKEWKKMLRYLSSSFDIESYVITQFVSPTDTGPAPVKNGDGVNLFASVEPAEIRDFLQSAVPPKARLAKGGSSQRSAIRTFDNSQEAVFEALRFTSSTLSTGAQDKLVLVTGSLYLVGEARTMWRLPEFNF